MGFNLRIVICIAAFAILYATFRLLKKHSLHPSYAVLWFFVGIFLFSVGLFEGVYAFLAREVFNLYGGDHLIYISLISFLLVYCFYLTSRICLIGDRVSKLISFTAVLENELSEIRKKKND